MDSAQKKRKAEASSRAPNAVFYETNDTTTITNVKDNLLVIRMGRVEAQDIVQAMRFDGIGGGARFEKAVEILGKKPACFVPGIGMSRVWMVMVSPFLL